MSLSPTMPAGGGIADYDAANAPQFPPGTIVPVETGTPKGTSQQPEPQQDFGPNNEKLPADLQNALRGLFTLYKNEAQTSRREEVRRIRQARQFWQGLQYIYFSDKDQNWHLPFEPVAGARDDNRNDEPRYMFVTNYFQAYGLSIIAVLSQDVPRTRLWPQSAETIEDVETARAGTEVIELVERNNRIALLQMDEAFHLWCDGKVGGYVRYIVDGARFGFHPEDDLEGRQVKMGTDTYRCPTCGSEQESLDQFGMCDRCGADLNQDNLQPADLVNVPNVKQVVQTPNGAEVIDIVGGLELKTPPWANHQHQFPYLIWQMEAHKARLRAAYPHVANKIGPVMAPEGSTDVYERTVRLSLVTGGQLTEGGDILVSLVTYERGWLRPWAFWMIDDQAIRDRLLALFPVGCYCAFAGDVYCESRNEGMDDHWRVLHAMPGDGQNRPALATSLISVQERINTLSNIEIETAEQGIPPTYASTDALDFDSLPNQQVQPGVFYPVAPPEPGRRLEDGFYRPPPASVGSDVPAMLRQLSGETAQFLTGAFPALFGGDTGGNDTASGIQTQRDQALGRIGLVWRRMKYFHADLMLLAVDVFRKNRPGDVEVSVFGEGGGFKSKWLRMADLKGNVVAYPETDEQYPTLWSQQRATLLKLMDSKDPMIQQVLGDPSNLAIIKRLVGLEDFTIPDDDARQKTHREIEALLQGQPTEQPSMGPDGQPQIDPATGQSVTTPMPTIMPDPVLDNHQVAFETVQVWSFSDAGQEARASNPAGYANVRAYAMMHRQMMIQQQMAQSMGAPAKPGVAAAPAS